MAESPRRVYIHMSGLILVLAVTGLGFVSSPEVFSVQYEKMSAEENVGGAGTDDSQTDLLSGSDNSKPKEIVVTHIKTPDPVKAIYMSQCVVGTPSFRDKLVKIADETEVNSIVIDIKDYTGRISFQTSNQAIAHAVSDECRAGDMIEFIDRLHKKDIYVIGRITVFQDPHMSKLHPEWAVRKSSDGGVWKDRKGLSFIDVGAKGHWDYIIEIGKEAYRLGFDELNFDYIRFPSDGNMADAVYTLSQGKTKPQALEDFFEYLNAAFKPLGIAISADLFGMVTTNYDDLNIGQVLERALPHFDYIAPMVYPSHYPKTFNGWSDPNKYPYELIKFVMSSAVERANEFDKSLYAKSIGTTTPELLSKYTRSSYKKLRPWIQDFDYGGNYDVAEVRAQIKATYDSGLSSWMLWAPSNIYTVGALEK